jgi:hypothetical protein
VGGTFSAERGEGVRQKAPLDARNFLIELSVLRLGFLDPDEGNGISRVRRK